MLQTGQVLFRRLSVDFALVLPFKDSQARRLNPAVLHPSRSNCRTATGLQKARPLREQIKWAIEAAPVREMFGLVRLRWSVVRPGSSSFKLGRQPKKRRLMAERRHKLHPHWKPFC